MIKMSPKYGVNPAKVVCFWCGGFTGRVVLLGHIKDPNDENTDIEAPDRIMETMVYDSWLRTDSEFIL